MKFNKIALTVLLATSAISLNAMADNANTGVITFIYTIVTLAREPFYEFILSFIMSDNCI